MNDYEYHDESCPKCGHYPTHERPCSNIHCGGDDGINEGMIDEYDFDPINFSPGEWMMRCPDCSGIGTEIWCPECGFDLSRHYFMQDMSK